MTDIVETLQQGLAHHRAGRLPEAERDYRKVLEINPRNAQAMHLLGLVAFQAGKLDLAQQFIEAAVTVDQFHAPFWADLAEVYRALELPDDSIAAYRKALEMNPEMADTWTHYGSLLQTLGKLDDAVDCYRKALDTDPDYAGAHAFLGIAMQEQGKIEEAQQMLEQAVHLAPNNPEIYLQLGRCLHAQHKWLDAIACYQKVRRLEPDHEDARRLYDEARAALAKS